MGGFLYVPTILFLVIVAPLWLFLHYRSRRHTAVGLSDDERTRLTALLAQTELLQQRVQTLERLLDADSPEWRQEFARAGEHNGRDR